MSPEIVQSRGGMGVEVKIHRNTACAAPRSGVVRPLRVLAGAGAGVFAALLMLGLSPAEARHHLRHHTHVRHGAVGVDPARESESIVIDADTGRPLSQMNADAITYPASLT